MGLFGCYLVFDAFVGFYVLFMFLICEDLGLSSVYVDYT